MKLQAMFLHTFLPMTTSNHHLHPIAMKPKPTILILLLSLFLTTVTHAQQVIPQGPEIKKRIETFEKARSAYIRKNVSLTDEEVSTLEKVLKRIDFQMFKLFSEQHKIYKEILNTASLTEDQYAQHLQRLVQIEEEIQTTQTNLIQELGNNFSKEKAAKVYVSLRRFQARLTSHLKKHNK